MYKIFICDDDPLFAELIHLEIEKYYTLNNLSYELTITQNAHSLLTSNISDNTLYLLDILMPDFSGLELAEQLRRQAPLCIIIFISNDHNSVYDSFRYSPLRFIRKERLADEIPEALASFNRICDTRNKDASILVHATTSDVIVSVSQIIYIESSAHYLDIYCTYNTLKTRGRISDYVPKMKNYCFSQANRGCLINLRYAQQVTSNMVVLTNHKVISLSRTYKNSFLSDYMHFIREGVHVITI